MNKAELMEKIRAKSTIKESAILSESKLFYKKERISTSIPMMNVALSGELDGGFIPGLTMVAGPPKHFKTLFNLLLAKAYMDKYSDSIMIFYDSEFGAPLSYFDSLNIDKDRVDHNPILDIEELKFDVVAKLSELEKGDKVIIVIDSIGNLPSIKEVEDAEDQKSVTDMTRAKALKSFFRIVPARCTIKNIPLLVVNHTYKELALYPKDIVSGGNGSIYNSDTIFIVGRQQDIEGTGAKKELTGYTFVLNVEKSRFVKEKSKINIEVSFEDGILKWSGLLNEAIEFGSIKKLVRGFSFKEEKISLDDINTEKFWTPILNDGNFQEFIKNKYKLAEGKLLGESNEEILE